MIRREHIRVLPANNAKHVRFVGVYPFMTVREE